MPPNFISLRNIVTISRAIQTSNTSVMKRSYLFTALMFFNLFIIVQASLPNHFPEEPQNNCYKTDAEKCYNLIENQARYLLSLVKPWHGNVAYKLLTDTQG